MKQPGILNLKKVTVATFVRKKLPHTPCSKTAMFPFTGSINKDTHIPTSYTTPICTGGRGIMEL